MAIANFTAALASRTYRNWFRALTPNVIKQGSSALRKDLESDAAINNFLLTDEKIRDMAAYVTDGTLVVDNAQLESIKTRIYASLKNAKNAGVQYNVKSYGIRDPKKGEEIVIENINFQTIETILKAGFGDKLPGWKRSVGSGFHRGHVYGIPTVLLNETISKLETQIDYIPDDEIQDSISKGKDLKGFLVSILKEYQNELRRQDIESSNMGKAGVNYDVYADYSKDPNSFLIEMQVRRTNMVSGQEAGSTLAELKRFLNFEKINAGNIAEELGLLSKPSVILEFLKSPGSPPWITLAKNKILNAIDPNNKSRDEKAYSISPVKVTSRTTEIKRSDRDKKRNKAEIEKVSKLIRQLEQQDAKVKNIKRIKKTVNLVQLQNLINQSLVERVKANMGTGNRRDILNLRTGRFAESVKVERMSEGRQGMITAFYTYMKNPYQTFEPGFQQGSPKSRDPKLLIAKSIREIASQQVANRLRSVVV